MKISLRNYIVSLMFISFLKPETVAMFPTIDSILNIGRIASAFIILFMYILRGKMSRIMLYIIILSLVFFLSTWLNEGDLEQCFRTYISIIVFSMLIEIEICKNALNFLRYLRRLLALLVFANFISILLFPDGFYVTHADSLAIGWFLGYKNSVMAFIMPFICVSLLYAHFTAGRITIGTTVILAISTYSIIHVWSATALVGMFIVLFFVAMIYKHNLSMKFNMHNYLIVVNIIFILIIVLGIQKYFSFLIEQILDKDLTFTGRIYVWEKAKFYISQYPIIGNAGIVSAHNMYLQIFYSGGATAFSVYLTIIYTVSKRLNHRKKSEFVNILSCVIFVYLIMALTESIFGWLFYGMCVLAYHVDRIIEQYTQYVGGETYNVNPSKI